MSSDDTSIFQVTCERMKCAELLQSISLVKEPQNSQLFSQKKRDADIRKNLFATVVSAVRGSVVPAKFIGKEPAESTDFLCDVDICKDCFVNAVPAGGTACSKGRVHA